ncbi:hypothetical protein AMELA_G00286780 [Ameiurus melas]|uniref:Uncharacterized protein n=1 Tax=Ameiurus melas TaxID=219545 RepID=A0A7J5ZKV9_AMEME|nr:hypothetical protein AMELA_G00286780 [Ameiurus melas]
MEDKLTIPQNRMERMAKEVVGAFPNICCHLTINSSRSTTVTDNGRGTSESLSIQEGTLLLFMCCLKTPGWLCKNILD